MSVPAGLGRNPLDVHDHPVEGDGSEPHSRHHGLITELECIEMCTLRATPFGS